MFTQQTIRKVSARAEELRIDPAAVLAVAEVESAGRVFWPVGGERLCAARFEGHYFYRRLSGAQRDHAVRLGLAHPSAGRVKNPRSFAGVYDLIKRAAAINAQAAYESVSWGLGQVMGAHWRSLGFASVFQMVETCQSGTDGQIDVMLRFIKKNGLVKYLQNQQWAQFAKRYNGPGYKKNNYHNKMRQAYARWTRNLGSGSVTKATRMSRVDQIRDYQRKLKTLGFYKGKVDGSKGRQTRAAIKQFQRANGLVIDGIVGPMTTRTMDEQLLAKDKARADKALGGGLGSSIGGGTLEGVRSQIPEPVIEPVSAPAPEVQTNFNQPAAESAFPQYSEQTVETTGKTDRLAEAQEGIQTASDSLMTLVWQTSSSILTFMVMGLALLAAGLTLYGLYLKFFKNKKVKTVEDAYLESDLDDIGYDEA